VAGTAKQNHGSCVDYGYYDPHARVVLSRPLVLTGHPGAGVEQVGRVLTGLTGLPFNHVERSAEASEGASRAHIAAGQGFDRLRQVEREALGKALRRRPYGVVVMQSALLLDEADRRMLASTATTVHLQRPLEILLGAIGEHLERSPGSLPEFLVGPPRTSDELGEFLRPREVGLSDFDWILEAGDRHPLRIAREILAALEELDGDPLRVV
jgi:shikimate kinase